MRLKYIHIILLIITCLHSQSQSVYYLNNTRRVSVETSEGEYSFEILTEKKRDKTDYELLYHWYDKGTVNITIGAYTGYLLHGEYIHFKKNSKDILEMGYLKNGLKSGTWMKWSENGLLILVDNWKNGKKDSESITYNHDQQIILKSYYKNGLLDGWQYNYKNGKQTDKVEYKNNHPYEGGFLGIKNLKLFRKKGKEDKIKNPNESKKDESINSSDENKVVSTDSKEEKKK